MAMADPVLTEDAAAAALAALGNRTRLRLLRLLVRAGADGLSITEVQQHLGIPASTSAHHLTTLARSGLVAQEKRGREVLCTARFDAIRGVAAYLTDACCAGVPAIVDSDVA